MKKLLLTIGLVAAGALAYGQGTVQFSNGTLYRISTAQTSDLSTPTAGTTGSMPLAAGGFEFGLFYGLGESTSLTLLTGQYGVNSTSSAGIISSPTDSATALNIVPIPGSSAGETDVWVQMAVWSGKFGTDYNTAHVHFLAGDSTAFWGQTRVANINALGPTAGPGVAIWSFSSSTNPKVLASIAALQPNIPEPSCFALAGLGTAALMIFRRRK